MNLLDTVNNYISSLAYERKPMSLYEPIRYVLSLGGKRIRPVLMLHAYSLYKDDCEKILPVAVGLETYHNYTLLHDDLMDKAPLRRGNVTVHEKWNANQAILSGDSMLVMAYEKMLQCDSSHLREVLEIFTETALQIGEGQQFDIDFETRDDVTEEEYIEMIRLKTSVLLACALKIGAILADAPEADCNALYRFGELMGLAFQLQDDYLDVYGDTKVFGKAIGGDILANKKTYMLINAINRASEEQKKELNRWIAATDYLPAEKIAAVTALYDSIGIRSLAEEKIAYYFKMAQDELANLPIPAERKAELQEYTEKMMKRKY